MRRSCGRLPWMRERGLGTAIAEQEFDFLGNAHGPDVSVMGPAKAALIDLDRRVQRFVPDLAIELASESDIRRPTGEERALFEIGSSRGLAVLAAHPGSRYLRR